jgi:hypothetical protein
VDAGDDRAVDHAPVIRVEQTSLVRERLVQHWPIDRHTGVVDPGVESSKTPDSFIGNHLNVAKLTNVTGNVDRFATFRVDLVSDLSQRFLVPGIQDNTRAPLCCHARRNQSDA